MTATPLTAIIVGAGGIARSAHLPVLQQPDLDITVIGIVDPDQAAATAAAEQFNIGSVYSTLKDALDAHRPDVVVLCSPPAAHAEQTVEALTAGAWVACEKPSVLSLAEDDRVSAAERPGGPYAATVLQHRHAPSALHAIRMVTDGALGPVAVAQCETSWFRDEDYFAPDWRGRYDGDGGPLMALGIHQIDLFLALLGPWRTVTAHTATRLRPISSDDVSVAIVEFESGALGTIVTSAVSTRQVSRIRIDAAAGTLELEHLYGFTSADWRMTAAPGASACMQQLTEQHEPAGHDAFYRSFLASVRAGSAPLSTGAARRDTIELLTAIVASASRGTPIGRAAIGPEDSAYGGLRTAALGAPAAPR